MPSKKKKGGSDDGAAVSIYARVRKVMPWEPKKISLKVKGDKTVSNKTTKATNEYTFNRVFSMDKDNAYVFKSMAKPLVRKVLDGFNAVLIAYGQTGSGKTHTLLGKKERDIKGVLPLILEELLKSEQVSQIDFGGIEAYGTHVSRIELFDLLSEANANPNWNEKKGKGTFEPKKATTRPVKDMDEAWNVVELAHAASHFAPTGKNPESSRGHACFVCRVKQEQPNGNTLTSFFVVVDLAGSEGESAFTPEFVRKVDSATLMARRLEAGCINNGLSQLQVIFNELRVRGRLSKVLGSGLRRILSAYINNQCMISVCFCLSPTANNASVSASTLKFAVAAGMVKVKPVKSAAKVNYKQLVNQLRGHVEEQNAAIDALNEEIADLEENLHELEHKYDRIESELAQAKEEIAKGGYSKASEDGDGEKKSKKKGVAFSESADMDEQANSKRKKRSKQRGAKTQMSRVLTMHLKSFDNFHDSDDEEDDEIHVAHDLKEHHVDAHFERHLKRHDSMQLSVGLVNLHVARSRGKLPGLTQSKVQGSILMQKKKKQTESAGDPASGDADDHGFEKNAISESFHVNSPGTPDGNPAENEEDGDDEANSGSDSKAVLSSSGTMKKLELTDSDSVQKTEKIVESRAKKIARQWPPPKPDDIVADAPAEEDAKDADGGMEEDEDHPELHFEIRDTSEMTIEEIRDYCEQLESTLIEEKSLRHSLESAQGVMIDHLMETNEALLKWFQMKNLIARK